VRTDLMGAEVRLPTETSLPLTKVIPSVSKEHPLGGDRGRQGDVVARGLAG